MVPLPARVCLTWEGPTWEGGDQSNYVNSAAEGEADDFNSGTPRSLRERPMLLDTEPGRVLECKKVY